MTPAASPALCRTCGAPLPGGKWSDACPRCLIAAFGEEDNGDADSAVVTGYTILEEISRGGMGVVYRARQHQPSRVVALKMILPHLLDSPMIRARFQAEAESVAKLDHPNVLPIYEAGENRGTPYLTMKFVAGGSLAAHRARFLGAAQACAELVAAAARGVQHAHERGILHRDLKPANLLLDAPSPDATPVPMVSDFGLARILESEPSGLTAPSAFMGTAGYLAPELAFGSNTAPTVQADIYSLGAILYELIAGQLPFGAETGLEALRRADRETPPSLRALNPRIPKDLDAICLSCLQREPSSRYRSAGALADDLDRFLEGSPVVARKDTMSYRAAKFARRNKAGLAATALVLLILVGGIIATSWQAHIATREKARAERRFNDVRKLAHSVLFDYHDAIKDLSGATKVRERLVKDGLVYLDSLAGEASGDPALQRELAAAYERLGDVRGQAFTASLGDTAGATESYLKALRIREALAAASPQGVQTRRDLASSYVRIANPLIETNEAARGMDYIRKALAIYLELSAEQPANSEIRYDLAATYSELGVALEDWWGDASGALENHHKALSLREAFVAVDPGSQTHRRNLSVTYVNIGRALVRSDDTKGALESNQKGLAIHAALFADNPSNADYRRLLAISYQNDGNYRAILHDVGGALQSFRKKLALDEQSVADDPVNAQSREDLGYSCERISDLLAESGDYLQALSSYGKALAMYEKVSAVAPQILRVHYRVIFARAGIGKMQAKLGKRVDALAECTKANALLNELPADPNIQWQNSMRGQLYTHLAQAYAALATSKSIATTEQREHWHAARNMYARSLEIWQDMQKRGILIGEDPAKEVASEIAKCDTALGR